MSAQCETTAKKAAGDAAGRQMGQPQRRLVIPSYEKCCPTDVLLHSGH